MTLKGDIGMCRSIIVVSVLILCFPLSCAFAQPLPGWDEAWPEDALWQGMWSHRGNPAPAVSFSPAGRQTEPPGRGGRVLASATIEVTIHVQQFFQTSITHNSVQIPHGHEGPYRNWLSAMEVVSNGPWTLSDLSGMIPRVGLEDEAGAGRNNTIIMAWRGQGDAWRILQPGSAPVFPPGLVQILFLLQAEAGGKYTSDTHQPILLTLTAGGGW